MHVGMAAVFQNPGKARSDRDVYVSELRLAEPLDTRAPVAPRYAVAPPSTG